MVHLTTTTLTVGKSGAGHTTTHWLTTSAQIIVIVIQLAATVAAAIAARYAYRAVQVALEERKDNQRERTLNELSIAQDILARMVDLTASNQQSTARWKAETTRLSASLGRLAGHYPLTQGLVGRDRLTMETLDAAIAELVAIPGDLIAK